MHDDNTVQRFIELPAAGQSHHPMPLLTAIERENRLQQQFASGGERMRRLAPVCNHSLVTRPCSLPAFAFLLFIWGYQDKSTKIFRPLFGRETVGFWMLYQRLTKVVLKIDTYLNSKMSELMNSRRFILAPGACFLNRHSPPATAPVPLGVLGALAVLFLIRSKIVYRKSY